MKKKNTDQTEKVELCLDCYLAGKIGYFQLKLKAKTTFFHPPSGATDLPQVQR